MSGRIVNVRPKPGYTMDSAGAIVPARTNVIPLRDGLANILTGAGTDIDRAMASFWHRRFSTSEQIGQAYLSSWLHRKIVDIVAEDMTRAGRDWDATDDEISAIEAEEGRLGYWPKLREALRLARLGGGAILIGLGDDPSRPLPANIRPGGLEYLMVLSRWQLVLGDEETDLLSPQFGQPRYFRLSNATTSSTVDIHPSRMVCFHGLPVPAIAGTSWVERFWGMSVVEACDEPVKQATAACAGFAALIDEAKVDVYRLKGLAELVAMDGGDDIAMKRIAITNMGKSLHRAVVLDEGDEWEQRQLSLAGVRDVIITYDGRVSGAADIPATRLFGKSPDGQNATGESDLANYFQSIGSRQEMSLRPAMNQLDAVVLPSAGIRTRPTWAFSPLAVVNEREAADIENIEADAVSKLVNTGLVPESALAKAVQNRLIESQRFPGLQAAIEEADLAGETDPAGLGIVPIEEGGDPASTVPGGVIGSAPPRAVNDGNPAEPDGQH